MTKRRTNTKRNSFDNVLPMNAIIDMEIPKKKFSVHDMKKISPLTFAQERVFDLWEDDYSMMLSGSAGTGKAQPLNASILTPNGWDKMGNVKVGDIVRSIDGWTTITGVFPQGQKKVVKFKFKDGGEVESCVDHIWSVYDSKGKSTAELKNLTSSDIMKKLDSGSKRNISIPVLSAIDLPEKEFVIPPYVMGCLIGDGSITQPTPSFTSSDSETFKEIVNELGSDYKFTDNESISKYLSDSTSSYKKENRLTTELKKLGIHGKLSNQKYIPEEYKNGSIEQRYAIIQGILDTDGTVDRRTGAVAMCTTSAILANDVRQMILSLGGKSSISQTNKTFMYKGEKKKGLVAYIVSINVPDKTKLFRLERKKCLVSKTDTNQLRRIIKTYEIIGDMECQCISVADKSRLYVTNDYILTHNTFLAVYLALEEILDGRSPYRKLVIVRSIVPSRSLGFLPGDEKEKTQVYESPYIQLCDDIFKKGNQYKFLKDSGIVEFVPTSFIRGTTFKDSIIVADECQNMNYQELTTILTRLGDDSKVVLCGDTKQNDLIYSKNDTSGFPKILEISKMMPSFRNVHFTMEDCVRSGFVKEFLMAEERFETSNGDK